MDALRPAVVCVFAKPARPGEVKTRLIPTYGVSMATELAAAFFADTWQSLQALPSARTVVATTDTEPGSWDAVPVSSLWQQGGGDLGERMQRMLCRGLEEAEVAIAIGADSPGLPMRLLDEARARLNSADAVLGPSDDGGFYLLALKRCPDRLLHDLVWSEPTTFAATRARFEEHGLRVSVLDRWFDVDRPEDLQRLHQLIQRGEVIAPETARVLAAHAERTCANPGNARPLRVSVIMPVLNEETRIREQLAALAATANLHEVIVVDGGSTDQTVARARECTQALVLEAARGRARQMNAGAAHASGDVLLFLHADVSLPADATRWIHAALEDPAVIAGAFRTWTTPDAHHGTTWLAPLLHLADLRSRYASLPYGDQALFVRTDAFTKAGGFPDIALMEDLELSRRLQRMGRIAIVGANVGVSGRRFLARPLYYALIVNIFPLLYRLGVPPSVLASLYEDSR